MTGVVTGAGAATAATSAQELAVPIGGIPAMNAFGIPVEVLLWDDRALVFGDNFGQTYTALYWLQ